MDLPRPSFGANLNPPCKCFSALQSNFLPPLPHGSVFISSVVKHASNRQHFVKLDPQSRGSRRDAYPGKRDMPSIAFGRSEVEGHVRLECGKASLWEDEEI